MGYLRGNGSLWRIVDEGDSEYSGGFGVGGGVRIRASERVYLSPEIRFDLSRGGIAGILLGAGVAFR